MFDVHDRDEDVGQDSVLILASSEIKEIQVDLMIIEKKIKSIK
jgi:hypothetical protein